MPVADSRAQRRKNFTQMQTSIKKEILADRRKEERKKIFDENNYQLDDNLEKFMKQDWTKKFAQPSKAFKMM